MSEVEEGGQTHIVVNPHMRQLVADAFLRADGFQTRSSLGEEHLHVSLNEIMWQLPRVLSFFGHVHLPVLNDKLLLENRQVWQLSYQGMLAKPRDTQSLLYAGEILLDSAPIDMAACKVSRRRVVLNFDLNSFKALNAGVQNVDMGLEHLIEKGRETVEVGSATVIYIGSRIRHLIERYGWPVRLTAAGKETNIATVGESRSGWFVGFDSDGLVWEVNKDEMQSQIDAANGNKVRLEISQARELSPGEVARSWRLASLTAGIIRWLEFSTEQIASLEDSLDEEIRLASALRRALTEMYQ